MFIPYHTDAPLYHRPIGTILLIVVNFVTFGLTQGGAADEGWLLRYGEGLHPEEWILSAFLHFGWMHLLGNMIFLWAFGLIVEGKIGTWRFLGLYLVLCVINGLIIQMMMLGRWWDAESLSPGAGGASGVIFGLMGIALVWAPANNFEVIWIARGFLRASVWQGEGSVLSLSLLYLGMNLVFAALDRFRMGSELLHLQGAVSGAGAGLLFLNRKWVDCEGWDIFSWWRKTKGRETMEQAARKRKGNANSEKIMASRLKDKNEDVLKKLRQLIQQEQFLAAYHEWEELFRRQAGPPELDLTLTRKLIDGLMKDAQWQPAVRLTEEGYLSRLKKETSRIRVRLAYVLVKELHRPRAALKHLDLVDQKKLTPEEISLMARVRAAADKEIEDGTMELA